MLKSKAGEVNPFHWPHVQLQDCFVFQVELKLTRYKGGTKGPVIVFHGLGTSSGPFTHDTVETNLTEYLVQHRYNDPEHFFIITERILARSLVESYA